MITYSTNWMGPISTRWYEHRNTHWKEMRWAGGRIDIYGLDEEIYYDGRAEYDLPIMRADCFNQFSEFLRSLSSPKLIPYNTLIQLFEAKHGKIVWASDVFEIDKREEK